jgi:hypothetical protein
MHASKTCEGLEVELHAIFNSILNAGEWKLHVSVAFTPGEIPRRYPLSRKQGGTYISWNLFGEQTSLLLYREWLENS